MTVTTCFGNILIHTFHAKCKYRIWNVCSLPVSKITRMEYDTSKRFQGMSVENVDRMRIYRVNSLLVELMKGWNSDNKFGAIVAGHRRGCSNKCTIVHYSSLVVIISTRWMLLLLLVVLQHASSSSSPSSSPLSPTVIMITLADCLPWR